MKLLLVGYGYLGQAIASLFRENAWEVIPVSLSGADGSISCDVGDLKEVAKLPTADLIIHCAASGRGGADAYRHVYVNGSKALTAAFPGVPIFFTSSTSVYAQTDGSIVDEASPTQPDRETGLLLLEAENVILSSGGIVTRLAGIYGPGRSVILKKFLNNETVIEEDGRRFLNQIHRDDAAAAIYHLAQSAAEKSGQIYNVSDSNPISQLQCHQILAEKFGRAVPSFGPRDLNRKRGWTHKRVSNAKLCHTGWTPRYPSFTDATQEIAPTL